MAKVYVVSKNGSPFSNAPLFRKKSRAEEFGKRIMWQRVKVGLNRTKNFDIKKVELKNEILRRKRRSKR